MKELPYLEEIYDLETEQLDTLLSELDHMLALGASGQHQQLELPNGFDSYDKFERKTLKLKEHLELELEERRQVDDVINFFVNKTGNELDFLNDDKFYQPMEQSNQQVKNEDFNIQSIMQRHQQQQTIKPKEEQLNDQNLAKLQQQHTPSSTNKDSKLETDTQFSEYLKKSMDDTQSQYTQQQDNQGNQASMFVQRTALHKNKKDLQQFMREKLQKTKIASESIATTQHIGVGQKNFTKKKKTTNNNLDDAQSTTTANSTATDRQTIYKPNLRRKTSNANKSVVNNTSARVSSRQRENKRSLSRTNSISEVSKDQKKQVKPQTSSQQPTTTAKLQQTIYKPSNLPRTQSKSTKSRPPLPSSQTTSNKPPIQQQKSSSKTSHITYSTKIQTNAQQPQPVDEVSQEQQQQQDEQQQLMGQEEIESKYSDDGDKLNQQMEDYKLAIGDEVNAKLDDFKVELGQNDQEKSVITQEVNKANDEEVKLEVKANNNGKDDEGKDDQSNGQEEEKGYNNEYGNEDDDGDGEEEDNDFYQPLDNDSVQQEEQSMQNLTPNAQETTTDCNSAQQNKNQLNLENNNSNQIKLSDLQIQTNPSSTTSKKIRGKVQVYVDEASLSVQPTPKTKDPDLVNEQLVMLEKQDQELNSHKPVKQSINPRMQQLKQLMSQENDLIKKQEQEERLKQVREQMQKEKEQKLKEQQTATQKKSPDNVQSSDTTNDQKQSEKNTNGNNNASKKVQEEKNKEGKNNIKAQLVKGKRQSKQVQQIPRQPAEVDQYIDYSSHYKTFYDIFVGQILDPKNFDTQFVLRDTRNMYAAFVNIMDANALQMKKKFQFDQAPMEKSLADYYSVLPDYFTLTGKSINDLEFDMKNRGNQLMLQAMAQAQLRNNFQQLKQKDVDDIVKEAQEKATNNKQNSLIDENRESSLYYRVVKNRSEVYDIISRAFSRKRQWNELPHGLDLRNSWNLLWTWSKIKIDITKLIVWQKCNHFSGAKNVSRKDFLKRNIERAQKMSNKAYQVFNILPLTFILPKEYVGFLEQFSEFEDKEGKLNYWIMKPAAKSRGRGISLVNDLTQITYGEPIVVQRYIKNPLLINGYKFDMRIYVLVTSVNPLEVFLYKEGFGRFSTMPFSLDPSDKNNKYIHLTNVSIQKYNANNSEQDSTDLMYGGTKISIQTLKKRVEQGTGINWDEVVWPQIREVVLKSLVACQNDIQFNPCCFELFGFDIMIDSDMKCWLIEINSSPSLSRETLLDDMIKQKLIDDIIDLVDPIDFDRKRLFEVLERRINEDFKQSTTSNVYSKRLMNRDLTYILHGKVPRKFGELPKQLGNFERLAPSPICDSYLKLIGGQKMFGSLMKVSEQQQQKQ